MKSYFFKKVCLASFFIIIWSLWKERNARVFNNSFSSLISQPSRLDSLRMGWWISAGNDPFPYSPSDIQRNPSCLLWNATPITKPLSSHPSSWSPPIIGCLKWNVDASFNPRLNQSSTGGVHRNHHGHFICLFSCPIPTMEINSVEVLAIYRAISI